MVGVVVIVKRGRRLSGGGFAQTTQGVVDDGVRLNGWGGRGLWVRQEVFVHVFKEAKKSIQCDPATHVVAHTTGNNYSTG